MFYCLYRLHWACLGAVFLWGLNDEPLKVIVVSAKCQLPLYEWADRREMRMDIQRGSSLCHTCMLGHAHSILSLAGDPSWHGDRSDVPLAKHKCPDQWAFTFSSNVTTGYNMIIQIGLLQFFPWQVLNDCVRLLRTWSSYPIVRFRTYIPQKLAPTAFELSWKRQRTSAASRI